MTDHGIMIAVPQHAKLGEGFSRGERFLATEHPGRQTDPKRGYQTPVAWISDLIALHKVLILCDADQKHFDARRFHYRMVYVPDETGKTSGYTVNGRCDWCKQETALLGGGKAFEPEEQYRLLHIEPEEARRAQRSAAMTKSVWRAVQEEVARRTRGR